MMFRHEQALSGGEQKIASRAARESARAAILAPPALPAPGQEGSGKRRRLAIGPDDRARSSSAYSLEQRLCQLFED